MTKKLKYIVLILFPILLLGQVRFDIEVEKNNLKIGESTQINYIFTGAGDDFNPPNFIGFNLVGSFQSSNYTNVNGVTSSQTVFTYVIQATKPGNFYIEPATVIFRGKTFKSKAFTINVANGKALQANGKTAQQNAFANVARNNKSQAKINNNLVFIEAQTNKNNAFLNEPVTVEYVVFIDPRIEIETGVEKKPKYSGFWSQTEDVKNSQWQQTQVGNKVFYSKVFKKAILYPQKTGQLLIDPIAIDFTIRYQTGETDFFGNADYQIIEKTISSNSKNISVNALPENGKPKNFTGAVGNFKFDVILNKNELKTGEAIKLDVVVSGNGNLKLFNLPKPNLPPIFEIFEPEHNEYIAENVNGISGKIVDSYQIVPQTNGWFNLKPQQFSFFDPNTESYKTINTKPVNVNVLKSENVVVNSNQSVAKNTIETIETETSFVKNETSFFKHVSSSLVMFMPFLCLPFFILIKRKKENQNIKTTEKKSIFKSKKPINYLENSEKAIANDTVFYQTLEQEINLFFMQHFAISKDDFSKDTLIELLYNQNKTAIIKPLKTLYNNVEMAKYASVNNENSMHDLALAKQIVNQILT